MFSCVRGLVRASLPMCLCVYLFVYCSCLSNISLFAVYLNFTYIHKLNLHTSPYFLSFSFLFFSGAIEFVHRSDFDENGIIYYLGTKGKTQALFENPSK